MIARFALCLWTAWLVGAGPAYSRELEPQTVRVRMSDGTHLATDVYLPTRGSPPYAAVLSRGPYGRGSAKGQAAEACRHGFAFISQDVRGRGDSEGEAVPIFGDGGMGEIRDGHETIAWIATQPWSNGRVGSIGGSALGITQNMQAPAAPQALRAQVVEVAFSDMYAQGTFQGGVWRKELIENWLNGTGLATSNMPLFRAHPRYDDFWVALNAEAQAAKVRAPGIFIGGWYDIFLQGTINSFVTIDKQGAEPARGNCRLIIGPWAHGDFKELKYPANSGARPLAADPWRFFAHWLRGAANGVPREPKVHYYLMGDPTDEKAPGKMWRTASNWPIPVQATDYFLHASHRLEPGRPTDGDARLEYQYNPRDPVPTIGGLNLFLERGPMDQRRVEERSDVLVFDGEPLAEPLELVGAISATLFVSSDRPDTDFTVKLCDVYPDGRSMLVADGITRARFRHGFTEETWLEPGEVAEIEVDLWSTALVLAPGHRLRVAVSSSNAPRFEPNPNTGADAAAEPAVAKNTLHLSAEWPSHITLPVRLPDEPVAIGH